MTYTDTFVKKPVFGMIHTGYSANMDMLELAKKEIEIYFRHGIYPLVENYFGSADDCETVLEWVQKAHPEAIYGVNILGDYPWAFELARKYGAKFIQIDSVCGHLIPENDEQYAENLQYYRKQNPDILVFGGVRFKYQPVKSGRSLAEDLWLGMERCDAIVCTGEGTGKGTPFEKITQFKNIAGNFPVIVGAGVTAETARHTAELSDGSVVGSWFKDGHKDIGTVNEAYVKTLLNCWNKGVNGPLREGKDLYDELMDNPYYHGKGYNWDNIDNEGMQTVNSLVGGYWKHRYLLDHDRKLAFEVMDEWQRWKHFGTSDIDWDSLSGLDEEAIDRAKRLSACYPSFIRDYEDGVAVVKWQLIPDGMYWMDEDGYGMTSDVETPVYAVVDKSLNVLVKFRYIGNDYDQLDLMRAEALEKLKANKD